MRSTKQELHELLAENLLADMQNMIDRIEGATIRAGIYTESNNSLVHRAKVLSHKLEKLRNMLATVPNNGLQPNNPHFVNYRISE